MKKNTIKRLGACAAAAVSVGVAAVALANPVFDGWYADPQMRRYGDTYWVFPTTSAEFKV